MKNLYTMLLLGSVSIAQIVYGQTISVEIPNTYGQSGTQVKISVNYSNSGSSFDVYSYQTTICFDTQVLTFVGVDVVGTLTENWQTVYNNIQSDAIRIAGFNAISSTITGNGTLVNFLFNVVGASGDQTDISFCLPDTFFFDAGFPPVNHDDASFIVASSGVLGDVDGNLVANSTDALIVLSCDIGINVSMFCPITCGDVNNDNLINSTDALIILSNEVGIAVPFPIGQEGCNSNANSCLGCQ